MAGQAVVHSTSDDGLVNTEESTRLGTERYTILGTSVTSAKNEGGAEKGEGERRRKSRKGEEEEEEE